MRISGLGKKNLMSKFAGLPVGYTIAMESHQISWKWTRCWVLKVWKTSWGYPRWRVINLLPEGIDAEQEAATIALLIKTAQKRAAPKKSSYDRESALEGN